MKKIEIKVQYFTGCPHSETMLRNTRHAILNFPDIIDYSEEIYDEINNNIQNFRGSPTLLINGEDYAGMPAPDKPNYACRYYPKGVPTSEEIIMHIKEIIRNNNK